MFKSWKAIVHLLPDIGLHGITSERSNDDGWSISSHLHVVIFNRHYVSVAVARVFAYIDSCVPVRIEYILQIKHARRNEESPSLDASLAAVCQLHQDAAINSRA
jgi:hypothetical protein